MAVTRVSRPSCQEAEVAVGRSPSSLRIVSVQRGHRGRGGCRGRRRRPSRRSLRGVPTCHRGGQAAGANLETGTLCRRDRGVDRSDGAGGHIHGRTRPVPEHRTHDGRRRYPRACTGAASDLRHRPLQHAVPVLHAGKRVCVVAAILDPHLRGNYAAHQAVREAGCHPSAPHRRRAALASRLCRRWSGSSSVARAR